MFYKKALIGVCAIALLSPAFGQTANNPTVINGTDSTGFPIYAPVGNGSNGSVPMPVAATITPSGTQNTNITEVGSNAVLTGAGATGTGSQRTTVAQDATTVAGSAPGTAGTPSANVVSVQGVTSGAPIIVTQSTGSTVGVEGADGSTQASTSNTFPVSEAPTAAAGNALVAVISQGASTLQVKNGAGNLYTIYATATADSWVMVFNSTSAPTNGSTTAGTASGNMQDCVKVPSGTSVSIGGLSMPERFSTGIYAALSSTACATLTLATTGLIHALAQ